MDMMQDPRFAAGIRELDAVVEDMPVSPDAIGELIKMIEFALSKPDAYPEILQAAIKDDYVEAGDLPEQFNAQLLQGVLIALRMLAQRMSAPEKMARGGLAQAAQALRRQGRHGDTMLAHISPAEHAMLRRAGGSGSVNPRTGLPEYFKLKKLLGAVLPIALNFFLPGAGTALGTALGASGAMAPILGGALIGGASSALAGGNVGQGALMGGLGGGLGGVLGGAVAPGASAATQNLIGSGLAGAAGGMLTGQGALPGAIQGALGQAAGSALGGMGGAGFQAAGQQLGNMLTAGYDPSSALLSAGIAGAAAGFRAPSGPGLKPSDAAVESLRTTPASQDIGNVDYSLSGTRPEGLRMPAQGTAAGAAPAAGGSPLSAKNLFMGATLLSGLSSAPQQVKQAAAQLSPQQQEYFNRPSITWDWGRLQADADRTGMGLSQFMAQNWNRITSGAYNQQTSPVGKARGGALSQIAYLARGSGSGRDDTINARLSDGEYVIDAETVALLGDGSTAAGARRLDEMRSSIRAHKGKALARGKFSPNARKPMNYLGGR